MLVAHLGDGTVLGMADLRRWLTDAEIAVSKNIAADDSADKWRHHFVPQFYLKRWLGGAPKLHFHDINQGIGGFGAPKGVAQQTHFYAYDSPLDPSLWVETHLSRVEDDASHLLRELDDLPDGRIIDQAVIDNLSVFVALQSQRTPRVRSVNTAIESWNPSGGDPQTAAIDMAIHTWRTAIVPEFASRTWWLVSSDGQLVTCDEPIVPVGYPGWSRKKRLSMATSALLLYPIGPHRLLILAADNGHTSVREPFQLTDAETHAVNIEVAANCLQYVYEQQDAAIAAHLPVPTIAAPTTSEDDNIFLATNLNTRWSSEPEAPPWPLARWVASAPPLLRIFIAKQLG